MTPPFFVRALSCSSVRLRSTSDIALLPECDAMMGALVMAMMSQNDFSAMCDTSIIMPRRFISATTCLPRGDSPSPWRKPCASPVFESESWLLNDK